MSTPLLSLVVLGFKNFNSITGVCLDSLKPWLDDEAVEIIVVDNCSPDDSAGLTADWCARHPQVRCLLSDTNRGFAGGMNWGAEQARGEWLLLVNNDTIFPAGTIDALKSVLAQAPNKVAMIGPVTNAAGNGQRLWQPGASHADWLQIGAELNRQPTGELMPAYRCDFFCIAIRHAVWKTLGGLDPAYGLGYYEDFDFSLRLKKADFQQMITEDVFILHVGSATFKGSKSARELIKRNKKLLKSKHPDAKFEHTRLGNLQVLQAYAQLKTEGRWSESLQRRLDLRIGALEGDAPRSFVKRWLWRRRVVSLAL